MKLKNLSLAIFSTLMLSACGGGSSSDSNGGNTGTGTGNTTLTKPDFQQWSSFYIDEYSDSDLNYEIEQLTFDQGNIYIKVDETTGWNNSETFYLTANGLYDKGTNHPSYGKLEGTITSNTTTWKRLPYSSINSKGLSETLTFKTLDISGKNVAAALSPNNFLALKYNLLESYPMGDKGLKFYTDLKNSTFPEGSTCIQIQKAEHTEDYIELYNYSLEPDIQQDLKGYWQELLLDPKGYTKKIFKDSIAYLHNEGNIENGFAEYKNNIYEVDFYKSGTSFNFESEISELNRLYNAASGEQKILLKELIDLQKSSCSLFNSTASKIIAEKVGLYK